MNNVVIVPGEQRRDSFICIHVSIFPQTSLLLEGLLISNLESVSKL